MAVAALVVYVAFVAVAFVWRAIRQYRRTGDHGFRGVSGAPGSAAWWGGVLFAVALVVSFAAPIVELAGLAPRIPLPRGARALGLALMLAGAGATLVAQLQMGASWRVGVGEDERTALVTHGLFAVVRNPIFSAMLVALAGLALAVPNALSWLAVPAALLAVELQVRAVEEPYLLRVQGEPYRAYARRVGRFVPGLGRLR
jgi:protein-S-isoprenylcysteine O-methyltransferase Ste14